MQRFLQQKLQPMPGWRSWDLAAQQRAQGQPVLLQDRGGRKGRSRCSRSVAALAVTLLSCAKAKAKAAEAEVSAGRAPGHAETRHVDSTACDRRQQGLAGEAPVASGENAQVSFKVLVCCWTLQCLGCCLSRRPWIALAQLHKALCPVLF